MLRDAMVPVGVAGFTAADEGNGGVEKCKGFGPRVWS